MFESVLPASEFPLEIARVLQKQDKAKEARPDLPLYVWKASRVAANTLLQWRVPLSAAVAAVLTPLLEHNVTSERDLAVVCGEGPVRLAKQLITLPSGSGRLEREAELSLVQYFMKLRRLFRWVYLDLDFVLLAMAYHDALLSCQDLLESFHRQLASETERVFVPLAEMLGIWALRRKWLNRCADILSGEEEGSKKIEEVRDGLKNTQKERERAFTELQKALAGKQGIREVRQREAHVGNILKRMEEGEPLDELTGRLTVEVFCDSIEDCYRALWLVHGLGKPVAPRFSQRFDDYIASPQPNGYQALHTAISFEYKKKSAKEAKQILVEFRILTDEMHRLNEGGVITALYGERGRYREARAWWNIGDQLSKQLQDRYKLGYTIYEFITKYELDSRPHPAKPDVCARELCPVLTDDSIPTHPIYAFTPRGEIYLLPDGATALDFAYHLHTEIGHHARKIWVNDRSVPLNYPIRNGDIVRVEFDWCSPGPDLSWMSLATTRSASYKIRQGLTTQAVRVHEGRLQIEQILIKFLRLLERSEHYSLQVTTNRLDTFLLQTARARGLPDTQALYSEVADGRIYPHKLVHQFISQELAVAIVDRQGRSIFSTYSPHQISLCERCWPLPGKPIVGRERRSGAATIRLTVHCTDNKDCRGVPSAEKSVPLGWAGETPSPQGLFAEVEIAATDRSRLLGDILDHVYELYETGLYLYEVNARVYNGDSAHIVMVTRADNRDQLANLRTRVERIPDVHSVSMLPLSHPRRLALAVSSPSSTQRIENPYTLLEVSDRLMFYDRDAEREEILRWLESPPTQWLILHGQRRVGKTSLAKHVEDYVMNRRVMPVFVDFQELVLGTPQEIADLIVRKVYDEAIQKPMPSPGSEEPAASFMNRALASAASKLRDYKLLLMIDEFNVLMREEEKGKLNSVIFSNLRSVLSQRRDVYFMLIVQDTHFQDPTRWGSAANLFGQARTLSLLPLAPEWARKLITDPLSRCGCFYEEAIVDDILALAAGVPYYVHVLCGELIEHLNRQNRKHITRNDLSQVLELVLSRGDRYFRHFTESLHGLRKVILSMIAARQHEGWVSLSDVKTELEGRGLGVYPSALLNTVENLKRLGMLEFEEDSQKVCIPIGLFHEWVKKHLDPDSEVQEMQMLRGHLLK